MIIIFNIKTDSLSAWITNVNAEKSATLEDRFSSLTTSVDLTSMTPSDSRAQK